MERIKINLQVWEEALCPIKTDNVNLDKAERDLYLGMLDRGWDEEFIENFFKKDPMEYTLDDDFFNVDRWEEEENVVINNGGIYYEDLEEDDNEDVFYEWCPYCELTNEFPNEFKPHKCHCCGKTLLPCSICTNYIDSDMGCDNCPFEE